MGASLEISKSQSKNKSDLIDNKLSRTKSPVRKTANSPRTPKGVVRRIRADRYSAFQPRDNNNNNNNEADDDDIEEDEEEKNNRASSMTERERKAIEASIQQRRMDSKDYNPFTTDMRSVYSSADQKPPNEEQKSEKSDNDAIIAGCFEFGELFDYWSPGASLRTHVKAIYDTLKEEVTDKNSACFINDDVWEELLSKAETIHASMYDDAVQDKMPAVYARNRPYFNRTYGIKANEPMSVDHIMAVVLYTDVTELQKHFKEHVRNMRPNGIDEDRASIAKKSSKYANWFRLLHECVMVFGDELPFNKKVYHGINCRLLFNSLQYNFEAPLSTTYDRDIAMRFSQMGDGNGIILELTNAESDGQPYFDVRHFSKFQEKEYLFYGATLKITSIILPDNTNLRKKVEILNFYMNLLRGNEIERFSATHSSNIEQHKKKLKVLCKRTLKLINEHMKEMNGDSVANWADNYVWRLFTNFTEQNKVIWVNATEIKFIEKYFSSELADKFLQLDHGVHDDDAKEAENQPGDYLKLLLRKKPHLKVCFAEEFEWEIEHKELDELASGEVNMHTGIVCRQYWDIYIDGDKNKRCTFGGNMVLENMGDEDEKMVGFLWRLSETPKEHSRVIVDVELYCPQIEFYVQFFDVQMQKKVHVQSGEKNQVVVNKTGSTRLFPLRRITDLNLESFHWRIIIKCMPVLS